MTIRMYLFRWYLASGTIFLASHSISKVVSQLFQQNELISYFLFGSYPKQQSRQQLLNKIQKYFKYYQWASLNLKQLQNLFLLGEEASDLIRQVSDLQYLHSQANKRDRS